MMRVSRIGKDFLICLKKDVSKLGHLKKKLGHPLLNNSLAIWSIPASAIEMFYEVEIIGGLRVTRYLDHFYLIVPENPIHLRQFYAHFFELIGEDYDALIDVDCNRENIENLLRILKHYIGPLRGARIIDYGCGTGLSLDIAKHHKINIIGFDPSPIMCSIASRRGMVVWDEVEILKQPYNSVDAAFSSYVFHILSEDEYLQILFNLLKPNGVLVANFQKNQNRSLIDNYLTKIGFKISIPPNFPEPKCHGSYVAYIKPK